MVFADNTEFRRGSYHSPAGEVLALLDELAGITECEPSTEKENDRRPMIVPFPVFGKVKIDLQVALLRGLEYHDTLAILRLQFAFDALKYTWSRFLFSYRRVGFFASCPPARAKEDPVQSGPRISCTLSAWFLLVSFHRALGRDVGLQD